MLSICDYHESNELSAWYSLKPQWRFQSWLCAGVWLDFNARRYWKLSLSWTCWRTTQTNKILPNLLITLLNSLYWVNECRRLQLTSLVLLERMRRMDYFALQQFLYRIPLLKFRYLGSFLSDYVPTLDNDTFAIINTQPSNMQGEHWIMIANFRHELYFAHFLEGKGYSFLNNKNQHYKQLPAPSTVSPECMRLLYNICSFSSLQGSTEKITGVHDVILISFISNYMYFFSICM